MFADIKEKPAVMLIKRGLIICGERGKWYIDISDEDALGLGQMIDNNDYADYIRWLEDIIEDLDSYVYRA